jgi:2-polyprenyl-3-methyl-5-hydroxy-6-metoxy-1,4-benzoquinol methylase
VFAHTFYEMTQDTIDFNQPQPYIKELLSYTHGGELLDIGAGWGRNSRYLASHGFAVTAIERDHDNAESLRHWFTQSKYAGCVIEADIRAWTPESKHYDVIICAMVLHFLSDTQEVATVLDSMMASTAPGGINIVSLYTSRNRPGTRPILVKPGWLPERYGKWQTLSHYEGLGRQYQSTAGLRRDYVERVTTKKPRGRSMR